MKASIGDGMIALAVALAIAAMAGCEAVVRSTHEPPKPQRSVEQICAEQWWLNDYCKALIAKRAVVTQKAD